MKNEGDLEALDIVLSEILRAENVSSAYVLGSRFAKDFEFSDETLKRRHVRALRALLACANKKDIGFFAYEFVYGFTESLDVLPEHKNVNEDDLEALGIVLSEILRAEDVSSEWMLGYRFSKGFEFSDEVLKDKHVRALRALLKHARNKDADRFAYRLMRGLTDGLAALPVKVKPE